LDDLVFVLDKNGVFLDYFQPSKLSDMYVPPREFLGSSYKDVMPPGIIKLMEDAEQALAETGEVQQFDYPLIIGGKQMWFSAKVSTRKDNTGKFAGYTMVARNITARKKAEEEIIRLASAMKMSTDSVIISDIEGNIIDVNDATLKLYGIEDKKELLGKSSFTLLLPGAEEKALALMEELLEKGDLKNQEIEALLYDGSVRILEVSISLLRGANGKVNGTVGITRDITHRKRAEKELMRYKDHLEELIEERTFELKNEIAERMKAEEALRESEERFRLAAKSSSDLIYEWDISTDDLTWFGDIDSALGFDSGEFPRTLEAWVNQIHPDDQARLADSVKLHRESTEPIYEEYQIKRKDGTWRNWIDRGTPVLDSDGLPRKWIGACIDITERK
jgi:PAS domain S-box-containing protein